MLQSINALVRFCVVTRFTYAIRTTPPALTLPLARRFDDAVAATLLHLYGIDVDFAQLTCDLPLMTRRLQLPLKLGGAGMASAAARVDAAYVGSIACIGPRLAQLVPGSLLHFTNDADATRSDRDVVRRRTWSASMGRSSAVLRGVPAVAKVLAGVTPQSLLGANGEP
jgi:hypothetical protein